MTGPTEALVVVQNLLVIINKC